jgi:hypothetical protein
MVNFDEVTQLPFKGFAENPRTVLHEVQYVPFVQVKQPTKYLLHKLQPQIDES